MKVLDSQRTDQLHILQKMITTQNKTHTKKESTKNKIYGISFSKIIKIITQVKNRTSVQPVSEF